jgi:[ribosomal protein S18]-alanine N-acetyltransferase
MVIQRLAPAHIGSVLELQQKTPEAPRWERRVYEELTQAEAPGFGFVAIEGDSLLGFAVCRLVLDTCELESIAVAAEARRRGIGATLLAAAADFASERGATRMELEVRAGNSAAIGFYTRMGFAQDGLRRAYYRNPDEDAVLMSRSVLPSFHVEKNL